MLNELINETLILINKISILIYIYIYIYIYIKLPVWLNYKCLIT